MDVSPIGPLLADIVLALHFGVALFVAGGALAVLIGGLRGWRWVRLMAWRRAHLAAIAVVVIQSWLGQQCPLTLLESWLRGPAQGSGGAYVQTFTEYSVARLLYYEAPAWVFLAGYSLLGVLVIWLWRRFPPQARGKTAGKAIETSP